VASLAPIRDAAADDESWNDIKKTMISFMIMGGKAAAATLRLSKWVTEAKANNGRKA